MKNQMYRTMENEKQSGGSQAYLGFWGAQAAVPALSLLPLGWKKTHGVDMDEQTY